MAISSWSCAAYGNALLVGGVFPDPLSLLKLLMDLLKCRSADVQKLVLSFLDIILDSGNFDCKDRPGMVSNIFDHFSKALIILAFSLSLLPHTQHSSFKSGLLPYLGLSCIGYPLSMD